MHVYCFIQVALTVVLLAILRVALVTLPTQVMTKAADKPLSSVNLSSPFCRSAPGSNRIGQHISGLCIASISSTKQDKLCKHFDDSRDLANFYPYGAPYNVNRLKTKKSSFVALNATCKCSNIIYFVNDYTCENR